MFKQVQINTTPLDRLATLDPEQLAISGTEIAQHARAAAQELIKYAFANGDNGTTTSSSTTLYVNGFDPEQIWLQLDLMSVPALKKARKQLKKVQDISTLMEPDVEEALDELLENDDGGDDDDEGSEEEEEEEDESGDEEDGIDYEAMLEAENADDDDEEEEEEEDGAMTHREKKRSSGGGKKLNNQEARDVIEDDFMKLDEMEAFLQDAERAEYDDDEDDGDDGEDQGEFHAGAFVG